MAADIPLTTKQVAELYQTPVGTLNDWALKGIGPRYTKVGRRRVYWRSDCDKFWGKPVVTAA